MSGGWIVQWHRWGRCPAYDAADFRRVVRLGLATVFVPRAGLAERLRRHRDGLAATAERLRAEAAAPPRQADRP